MELPNKKYAVILGNGPSLLDYRGLIDNLVDSGACIYGVNRIYLSEIKPIHYYLALDKKCWQYEIKKVESVKPLIYFAPDRYGQVPLSNVRYFKIHYESRYFSPKLELGLGHGYTSVYACLQLAAMQKPKEIHMFGVDFSAKEKTHFWGNANRSEKSWYNGQLSVVRAKALLKAIGIDLEIHSQLFWESANVRKIYQSAL